MGNTGSHSRRRRRATGSFRRAGSRRWRSLVTTVVLAAAIVPAGAIASSAPAGAAEAVAQPTVTISDAAVGEGDGGVDLTASLDEPGINTVTVDWTTVQSSACNCGASWDYTGASGTLTFTPGQTTKTVHVDILDDAIAEDLESFPVRLSLGAGNTSAVIAKADGRVQIVDNDAVVATPAAFVRDAVVDRMDGTVSIPVVLGAPHGTASNSTVSVGFATANGTATAGTDYTATSGTLFFQPGQVVKTVKVSIAAITGPIERFTLNLSSPSGATIADGTATVTIGANNLAASARPSAWISDTVVGERDGYANVVVSLDTPGTNRVTMDWTTVQSSACNCGASWDYLGGSGVLTFAPGETTKTIRVELNDDLTAEDRETFPVRLSLAAGNTSATIAKADGFIAIVDDDTVVATPKLFVRDTTVDRKDDTVAIPVVLGGPHGTASNVAVTVAYATSNGTATAGADYTATSGTLRFAPGQVVKSVIVPIAAVTGPAERFTLTLSSPSGATIADGMSVVTLGGNDATTKPQPALSITDTTVGEGDGYAELAVTIDAPSPQPVTVDWTTVQSSACNCGASWDYHKGSGLLTFAPGQTTRTIRLHLYDDNIAEDLESFPVRLSLANGNTSATIAKADGFTTIIDNDDVVATPTVSVADATADRRDGTVGVPVTLGFPHGQASNASVSVAYTTVNGSAVAGTDFTATSGTLRFAPGQVVKTITVPIAAITAPERQFTISLSVPSGVTIADGTGLVTLGRNDATPKAQPALSITDTTVGEGGGFADLVVSLDAPGTGVATVGWTTVQSTACNCGASYDYVGAAGTLTFAPGQTTKVVHVQLYDDNIDESYESFPVRLSSATGATIAKANGIVGIIDDDGVPTVPGAPTIGTATAGHLQATVTWTIPADQGDTPVSGYIVTPYIGGVAQAVRVFDTAATSQVVTGLVDGTAYTFKVAAKNSIGTGPQSGATGPVTPAPSKPSAPVIGTATAGAGQATVTWTAPPSDGGSAITGYTVTPYIGASSQGARVFASTATNQTVTGLTNGTTYTFKVAATNSMGTGAQSAASNAVTPATTPSAPIIGVATAGVRQATVRWSTPASNGGSAITGYRVTPFLGVTAQAPQTFASTATTQTVTGLVAGKAYTFTVVALNAIGAGPASAASSAITLPDVPGAPTITSVAGANGKVTLKWSAPASTGGSSVTGYAVTPYIGAIAQAVRTFTTTATTQVVTGLANGTAHTFRVAATNAVGTGPQSARSSLALPPFPTPTAFVNRQYSDFLGRAPTAAELSNQLGALASGGKPGSLAAGLRTSADATSHVDPTTRLYFAYFLRIPDASGLTYWIGRKRTGTSLTAISNGFAGSAEFKQRYGALSNAQFVNLVYLNVLGRPGDAGGVSYWTGQLETGKKTRGEVMAGFSESAEYKRIKAPAVNVAVTWIDMLGAGPDATSFADWVTKLGTGGGKTVTDLATLLLADSRYATRVG